MGSPCALCDESFSVCLWCLEFKRVQEFRMTSSVHANVCNECSALWADFWKTLMKQPDCHYIEPLARRARGIPALAMFMFSQWRAFQSRAGAMFDSGHRFNFNEVLQTAFSDKSFYDDFDDVPVINPVTPEEDPSQAQQEGYQTGLASSHSQPLPGQPEPMQSPTPGTPASTSAAQWQAQAHDDQAGLPSSPAQRPSGDPNAVLMCERSVSKRPLACLYEELTDIVQVSGQTGTMRKTKSSRRTWVPEDCAQEWALRLSGGGSSSRSNGI